MLSGLNLEHSPFTEMDFETISVVFCVTVDDFNGSPGSYVMLIDEVDIIVPEDKTAGSRGVLYVEVENAAGIAVFSGEGSFVLNV